MTLWFAWVTPDETYRQQWGAPKVLAGNTVFLFALGAGLLVLGSLLAVLVDRARLGEPELGPLVPFGPARLAALRRCAVWLFTATMLGYAAFVLSGLRNGLTPGVLIDAVRAQDTASGDIKDLFGSVPGLTTFTQFGIAFVVVASILLTRRRDDRLLAALVLVLVLAVVRAYLFSERLAVLELAVPAAVVMAAAATRHQAPLVRALGRHAPVVAVPLLVVLFGAFEYSRSWVYYSSRTTGSFGNFVVQRLAGYYATAYNNGQISILYEDYPSRLPFRSVEALWTAPVVEQMGLYPRLAGQGATDAYRSALLRFGNPEFNSPGGLAVPLVDFGTAGGLLFLLCCGLVVGAAYASYLRGDLLGVLVYPPLVVGLFELPRYLYWTQGRFLPSLVALVAVVVVVRGSSDDAVRRPRVAGAAAGKR